eukprot:4474913-Pleurochrysis_carterae.AAC.2
MRARYLPTRACTRQLGTESSAEGAGGPKGGRTRRERRGGWRERGREDESGQKRRGRDESREDSPWREKRVPGTEMQSTSKTNEHRRRR